MELKPGKYHLEVSAAKYRTWKEWVDLSPGEEKRVQVNLTPIPESNIETDAKVVTDASGKKSKTYSKKIPDRSDASKIKADYRAPLETACLNGNSSACNDLGVKYATGKGVTLDLSRAMEFYRKACDGGSIVGCSNLAFMYRNGKGVTRDDV